MARAACPRAGRLLWLACLLPFAPAAGAAGAYELHLTSDGPATTGTEVSITASLVAKDNGSLHLPPSTRCRFHWVHAPLLLTGRVDEALSSTVRAVGTVPGDVPVSVWVTAARCGMCRPLARSFLVLPVTEFLVGKLDITQNTSLPQRDSYLTGTPLKISFLLHDPSNFFKAASFLYSWDFGDGVQLLTVDSMVYYNYSAAGTFRVKLEVVAEWAQESPEAGRGTLQKTGTFNAVLRLQETLQGIQVSGPSLIQTFQTMTVTLKFLGSGPLTTCWRLTPECLPLDAGECHPQPVTGTAYNLSHTFRAAGEYCFSIRAENGVSKSQHYHRVQVWPSSTQPAAFAFPCATLLTMTLAFVVYLSVRSSARDKDLVESPEPAPGARRCCGPCCGRPMLDAPAAEYLEVVRETQGLLSPLAKAARTYTV
ncbi:transmembrane protein 130 isoform X2 [Sorex araneus]|uniref:transmembrane protein 130 isoform X2 n=1 Tax=Sorex araneus TaxID=42254 RepID=UPI002433EBE1|nr:transmembrane protein 130 isoform X2 [Sorex araneus]